MRSSAVISAAIKDATKTSSSIAASIIFLTTNNSFVKNVTLSAFPEITDISGRSATVLGQ
jgi:hypothetical protein